MIDFITGEKFKTIADFTYSPKQKMRDDYDNLQNTMELSNLKDRNIVYTHISYAPKLLNLIAHLKGQFILITHSCDCRIEDKSIIRPNGRGEVESVTPYVLPDNLIKWYTKNVNCIHPKIESIPIGLENSMWFPDVRKKEKILQSSLISTKPPLRNLVYLNVNRDTNMERLKLYSMFRDKTWVTCENGVNGRDFDRYLDNLQRHRFVFSPQGNGMDTHRTWECLYVKTIPIEKRNLNNRFYTDLPICFVDDWSQVTYEFLLSEYTRIWKENWDYSKLTFEYWKNKILNT